MAASNRSFILTNSHTLQLHEKVECLEKQVENLEKENIELKERIEQNERLLESLSRFMSTIKYNT